MKIKLLPTSIILIVTIALLVTPAICQINQFPLQISGRIANDRTGEPISAVNIQVLGTSWGTYSDPNGCFEFSSIPEGSYQLKISHISYVPKILEIQIQSGISQSLTVNLTPSIVPLPEANVEIPSIVGEMSGTKTVIDRRIIERSNARSVGDLLVNHGDVFIKEQGAAGGSQFASIRGSASNQVLVVMDGHRLNAPGSGEVDLSTIPLDAIERVEIIKGSSLEYGGDAIGGIIQIITKSLSSPSERNLTIDAGSFSHSDGFPESRRGQFYLSRDGNPAMAFSGSIASSRGNYEYTDRFGQSQIRDNSDSHSQNLFWKAQGRISHLTAILTASQYQVERGIPGDLDQLTPQARLEQRKQEVSLSAEIITTAGEISGLFYGGNDIAHHRNPTAFIPLDARHTEQNAGGKLSWKTNPVANLQLLLSHEARWDGMTSPSVEGGNVRRWSHGSVLQGQYGLLLPRWLLLPNLQLKSSVRRDQLSEITEQWTYHANIFLSKSGMLSYHLRGSIGTAFRPPTFTSLFWKEDVFARGNPDLKPENSLNRELGAGSRLSQWVNLQFDITRFWQNIDNIILWRRSFDGRWAPYNVSHAEIDGVELSTKLSPRKEWTWVEYTGTFLTAINRSGEPNYDGKDLTYRPRRYSRLSTGLIWKKWRLDYDIQWVSRRHIRESNSIPLAAEGMGPYRLMNGSLGKEFPLFGANWRMQCEIRNLENQEYRVVERSPMPGREWRASVRVDIP